MASFCLSFPWIVVLRAYFSRKYILTRKAIFVNEFENDLQIYFAANVVKNTRQEHFDQAPCRVL